MNAKKIVASTILIFTGLSISLVTSASTCSKLSERNFVAIFGDDRPLSNVLHESLKKTGWSLKYKVLSSEPEIKGEVKGTVEAVILGLVSKSVKKGWRINLFFDNELCIVDVNVLNETAPNKPLAASNSYKPIKQAKISPEKVEASQKSMMKEIVYKVHKGEKLSDVFKRWAKSNGGDAYWFHKEHIIVLADVEFVGSLGGAVIGIIRTLGKEGAKIRVETFKNGYIRVESAK